jgi:hypothetical protein
MIDPEKVNIAMTRKCLNDVNTERQGKGPHPESQTDLFHLD